VLAEKYAELDSNIYVPTSRHFFNGSAVNQPHKEMNVTDVFLGM